MEKELIEEFLMAINALIGKACWGIAAGPNMGSVIDLELGEKIPLRQPGSSALTNDLCYYRGEYTVMIECSWRLDAKDRVICGWAESNLEDGVLSHGLQLVLNQTVENVTVDPVTFDFSLYFSNALTLRGFCDQTDASAQSDNYTLFTPRYSYVITKKSNLTREERDLD